MNGSFVIPTRTMCAKDNARIWRWHSIIGLVIIPWVFTLILAPQDISDFFTLSSKDIEIIIFGGIVFGIGQVFFSYAIESVGMALSFATNLGVGVVIGSLFTVVYQQLLFSSRGILVIVTVLIILLGLAFYYFSSKIQRKNIDGHVTKKLSYNIGWLLAVLAGITSGFQSIVFTLANSHQQHLFQNLGSFWVWPIFLTAAAFSMVIGFSYKINRKNEYLILNKAFFGLKEGFLLTLMGVLFSGSLVLYSRGVEQLDDQRVVVAWPAFMVSIILTSQLWSWVFGEDLKEKKISVYLKWASIFLMVVAIVLLSFELR